MRALSRCPGLGPHQGQVWSWRSAGPSSQPRGTGWGCSLWLRPWGLVQNRTAGQPRHPAVLPVPLGRPLICRAGPPLPGRDRLLEVRPLSTAAVVNTKTHLVDAPLRVALEGAGADPTQTRAAFDFIF